jgi:molecular chaperone DnaJ
LTLEEVANGVEKKVKVKRKVQAPGVSYKTCSTCNGQGLVMGQHLPSHLAGSGILEKFEAEGMIVEDETVSSKILLV